mgnify:CR=1 FL=1
MKVIRLYHNKDCQRCVRLSRILNLLDWRDRVESTSAVPHTGPLRLGEIAIEDLSSGQIFKGHRAFDQLCRNIPLYSPARILLRWQWSRDWLDRSLSGCASGACSIS